MNAYFFENLKVNAKVCLYNYKATRKDFYLNQAINLTRMALKEIRK